MAIGLGQQTKTIKVFGMILVSSFGGIRCFRCRCGWICRIDCTSLTRLLVGHDYRWIIPCSSSLVGLLVVLADLAARMINPPYETPIGALIALIGVPFFLYLARKGGREL